MKGKTEELKVNLSSGSLVIPESHWSGKGSKKINDSCASIHYSSLHTLLHLFLIIITDKHFYSIFSDEEETVNSVMLVNLSKVHTY